MTGADSRSLHPALAQTVARVAAAKAAARGSAPSRSGANARFATIGPALAAILVAGLALRLYCSTGPLWIDEIWSIINLDPIQHFWGIFWGISHDNNHFANSLWLYSAGSLSPNPTWLRAPSIIAGTLSIAAMARLGARHSRAAAIAGAALIAFSFFFLNYSVEARGYAAAMLALMIAYDCLERAIDNPRSNARYGLAGAAGLGLFCHFAIGPALVLFGVIALLEIGRRNRDVKSAVAATFHIFWPAALAAAPVIACVIAGYFVMGGFTIGGIKDYTLPAAVAGMAKMALLVLGLPESPLAVAFAVIGVPLAILAALSSGLVRKERRIAYAIILIALPLAVFAAHPPNTNIPRYYFVSAVFLVLLIAECFGSLWRFGGWRRAGAGVALGAMLAGGAVQTRAFQDGKSPAWPEALDAIAASGQMATGGLYDRNVHEHVAFYNRTHNPPLEFVPPEQLCARRPQWFIAGINDIAREPPPPRLDVPGEGCALHYDLASIYGAPGLSQTPWALYRQIGAALAK
jgi:Dolichyl-phosphate-mannose-protein mannosyltransferase